MSWAEWYSNDLPCLFTRERTRENAEFLTEVLSAPFVASRRQMRSENPMLCMWDNPGPASLLYLNSLTEDLRLLDKKPNVDTLVSDLRDDGACLSAWHTLRSAALLERAEPGTIVEFIRAQNATVPDFVMRADGGYVPVEAKLLTVSELEEKFHRTAENISQEIVNHVKGRADGIHVTLVVKTSLDQVAVSEAALKVTDLLTSWAGADIDFRSDAFNVRIERPKLGFGIAEHRLIHVLMPVPLGEALRVRDRAKKASSQLRSLSDAAQSGVLALGLSDRQDGSLVFDILGRAMKAGRYRGVAAAFLLKTGVHLAPPQRTIVNLAEIRFNRYATAPLKSEIHLRSLGPVFVMTKVEPPYLDVPAYRHLLASGRPTGLGGGSLLGLNDVPRVPRELLI